MDKLNSISKRIFAFFIGATAILGVVAMSYAIGINLIPFMGIRVHAWYDHIGVALLGFVYTGTVVTVTIWTIMIAHEIGRMILKRLTWKND